jgi:hypothetical protein
MKCSYCSKEIKGPILSRPECCSQRCEDNHAVSSILEKITEELDIVYKANVYPWKVKLTAESYDVLLNRPGTHWVPEKNAELPRNLIYGKNGREYLVCWENHNIPFIIHARIADVNAREDDLELDDLDRPNIQAEYKLDWENHDFL